MHIRPFHASDFSAIATITAESFFTDQLFDYICPSRSEYPDHFRARFLHELKIKYYAGHHFYVVVTDKSDHDWDGEEQVMGYAAWVLAGGGTSKQQEGKGTVTLGTKIQRFGYDIEVALLRLTSLYKSYLSPDLSADPHAISHWLSVTSSSTPKAFESPHWHLSYICVSPHYQRRGVGTVLLNHGKEFAKRDDLPILFCASPMGQPMYVKNGFRKVAEVTMPEGWDVEDWWMGWGDFEEGGEMMGSTEEEDKAKLGKTELGVFEGGLEK